MSRKNSTKKTLTTFSSPPIFLTFQQWIAENPEVSQEDIDCDECNGTGETECPHCGHSMECEECNCSGSVSNAEEIYEEQRERDAKLWERYLARVSSVEDVKK